MFASLLQLTTVIHVEGNAIFLVEAWLLMLSVISWRNCFWKSRWAFISLIAISFITTNVLNSSRVKFGCKVNKPLQFSTNNDRTHTHQKIDINRPSCLLIPGNIWNWIALHVYGKLVWRAYLNYNKKQNKHHSFNLTFSLEEKYRMSLTTQHLTTQSETLATGKISVF